MDQSRDSQPLTARVARAAEGRTYWMAMGLAVASNWARMLCSVRPRSRMSRSMRRRRQTSWGASTKTERV